MRNDDQCVYENNSNVYSEISSSYFYAKVFLYFGLSLILTAIFTIGLSYLFNYIWPITEKASAVCYTTLLIISVFGIIISSIVVTFRSLKKSKGGIVSWLFYILFMSILLSSLSYSVGDLNLIGIAVIISSALFLIMCIFGFLFKGKLNWLISLALGLGLAILIMYLVNTFLIPILYLNNQSLTVPMNLFYIIDFAILAYSSIIVIIDVAQIKRFANNHEDSSNIALYFALNLYNDYIIILLRIISILLRSKRN